MKRNIYFAAIVLCFLSCNRYGSVLKNVQSQPRSEQVSHQTLVYRYNVVNHIDSVVAETQIFKVNVKDFHRVRSMEITPMSYQSSSEDLNISIFNIDENLTVLANQALQGTTLNFRKIKGYPLEFSNESEVKETISEKVWNAYHELFERWAPTFEFTVDEMHNVVKEHCEEAIMQSAPLLFVDISDLGRIDLSLGPGRGDSITKDGRRFDYTPAICDEESALEEVKRTATWNSDGTLKEYSAQYVDNNIITHSVTLKQIE